MRDAIAKITNKIKKTIRSINFKSKKTLLFIGLFVFALATSVILISYSYYTKPGDQTLVIGGFALVSDADITLKVYIEDRNSSGNGTGTYSRAYYIPTVNYTYNSSSSYCTEGITINGFENSSFDISASKQGFCKVYFDAVDGYIPSGTFKLFVEQTKDASDYEQMGKLPDNDYVYSVNNTKTTCTDSNAVIEVVNRKIEITTSTDVDCEVYVDIEALTGGAINYLSDTIIGLESSADYTSSQDNTVYRVFNENGTRYAGKNPDNYITFNGNEEWRIIGVFEGSDIGANDGESYTKIIRNDSIGNFAWNEHTGVEPENDWVNSTLNTYLNETYFQSLSIDTQQMVYNAKWYLSGVDSSTNATASDWWLYERTEYAAGYFGGQQYGAASENVAAVGLMYPSDYGYAAYGTGCDITSAYLGQYSSNCASVDWMYRSDINSAQAEWTISAVNDNSTRANAIMSGSLYGSDGVYDYIGYDTYTAVRPTLYLSSDVFITGGSGKQTDPYTIDL